MVITGTLGYALFKAPIIILRAMVKPKLQLRPKSTRKVLRLTMTTVNSVLEVLGARNNYASCIVSAFLR